jgi:sensor histidine kinase YesM
LIARLKVAILGWAAASVFFTAVLVVSDLGHKPLGFALYSNAVHFALWTLALPLLAKAIRVFPLKDSTRFRNASVILIVVAALAMLIIATHWAIIFSTYFPYRNSYPTFRSFLESELVRFLPNDILIGIVLVIALEGWRVLLDFQAERIRSTDLERQLAVSRLDALRMQLHPHFLFNTLHTIAGLIVEQPAAARRMVIALGDLLRLTLKDTGNSVRSLAKELEFADLYLGIEKLRLGDRLVLNYDIEPEATSAEVPQLLLQPLFENAVRHGAARTLHACGIRFCAHREGNRLRLTLHNDGPPRPPSADPPAFGVGLTNTIARLRLHYKDQFTFQYSDHPKGGVEIGLSLPYKRADDMAIDGPKELYAARAHADR